MSSLRLLALTFPVFVLAFLPILIGDLKWHSRVVDDERFCSNTRDALPSINQRSMWYVSLSLSSTWKQNVGLYRASDESIWGHC